MKTTSVSNPMVVVKRDELASRLARKNKSQRWLAKQIEVSSGFMSQILSGKRNPSPDVRQKLMDKLGVEVFDDLFLILPRDTNA